MFADTERRMLNDAKCHKTSGWIPATELSPRLCDRALTKTVCHDSHKAGMYGGGGAGMFVTKPNPQNLGPLRVIFYPLSYIQTLVKNQRMSFAYDVCWYRQPSCTLYAWSYDSHEMRWFYKPRYNLWCQCDSLIMFPYCSMITPPCTLLNKLKSSFMNTLDGLETLWNLSGMSWSAKYPSACFISPFSVASNNRQIQTSSNLYRKYRSTTFIPFKEMEAFLSEERSSFPLHAIQDSYVSISRMPEGKGWPYSFLGPWYKCCSISALWNAVLPRYPSQHALQRAQWNYCSVCVLFVLSIY